MARHRRWRVLAGVLGAVIVILSGMQARADLPIESEPISYLAAPVDDPIARLQKRLDAGELALSYDKTHGYLPAVLDQLKIPKSSQVLVFSKTSFQHAKISRTRPRALYFNDSTYVGWVDGGDALEFSAVDPRQGAIFYLLDQDADEKPVFRRQTHECLQCHVSSKTQEIPGHFVRSVVPDRTGSPIYNAGTFVTNHESPLNERWGGWYVTGTHGAQTHMRNVTASISGNSPSDRNAPARLDTKAGANLRDLSDRLNTKPYLTGHSDIVALMALEHQTQMHNFIALVNYQTRLAMHYQAGMNKSFDEPASTISEGTRKRIESAAEKLVRYMLFVDEAPLSAPISGSTSYATDFTKLGPRDARGRSLRDFDLKRRMFTYPCSYLIYSEAFDALPKLAKEAVYRRLWEVLRGKDQSTEFAHLSSEDRRAILEILRETKPRLPDYFRAPPAR
ncbi:MAG: hypothetical protein JWN86_248 [Planctomycetota bacterium]|nr:hypothetical protein [Planctomycetota bacterium]